MKGKGYVPLIMLILGGKLRMATLFIHAPKTKVVEEGKQSFETTLATGIGDGYAIAESEMIHISPGCNVVLLDNPARKRAEGKLESLVPKGKTDNGIRRYDVKMRVLKLVAYQKPPDRFNFRGVLVL